MSSRTQIEKSVLETLLLTPAVMMKNGIRNRKELGRLVERYEDALHDIAKSRPMRDGQRWCKNRAYKALGRRRGNI